MTLRKPLFLVVAVFQVTQAAGNERATRSNGPNGAALYQEKCAACHGSIASSDKRGRSAAAIENAIRSDRGGMGFLSSVLRRDEVAAIALALK